MNSRHAPSSTRARLDWSDPRGQPIHVAQAIERCLSKHLSPITAASVVVWICKSLEVTSADLNQVEFGVLTKQVDRSLSLYMSGEQKRAVMAEVKRCVEGKKGSDGPPPALSMVVASEADVTLARASALRTALALGFDKPDAVKVSTVVSELARNILQYAKTGSIDITAALEPRVMVRVVAIDNGPGIPNLNEILAGRYRSRSGMGLGLLGSKRLMDSFAVRTAPNKGTTVIATKFG